MPILTRWFIKTALVYFVTALVVGVAQAVQAPLGLPAVLAAAGPVYVHLLVVGWITQMILGVAYWMFPKHSKETPRGSDRLAIASYWFLNLGLLLRVFGEPAHTVHPAAGLGWLLGVSAALQWLGGMAFVVNTWARVKER
ncbi:MAG TPA: hypothetical protein VFU41_15620 [Gemmatimonadales bacterium]|nr:hypothetical protein [Gemmatimonadales bacterium]